MSLESAAVPVSKFFEDVALLTMVEWKSVSRDELRDEHSITFSDLNSTATDFAIAEIGENITAVRYSWTLAGSVQLIDVHVFVYPVDEKLPAIQRHYRVRATEWI